MKKQILATTIILIGVLFSTTNAQNLSFDNTFNNANPQTDQSSGGFNPNEYIGSYGQMKKVNDSTFVYFVNYTVSQSQFTESVVFAKIIHNNGTVTSHQVFAQHISHTGMDPISVYVTDVVVNSSTGDIYVLINEIYDDNGTTRIGVRINAFSAFNGLSFPINTSWGNSGTYLVTSSGSATMSAKGVLFENNLMIAYSLGNVPPIQIAFSTIAMIQGNPTHTLHTIASSNFISSSVADIIAVSATEVYIACNSLTFANQGGVVVYDDVARVIKWNPTNSVLSSDYSGNGTGISVTMPWNEDVNTAFVQDHINRILYDGSKILVVGRTRINNGVSWNDQGRLTRLNSNGTIDTTFAIGGTFAPDFTNKYYRWSFNDIDLSADGKFYISAGGQSLDGTVPDVYKGFILPLSSTGDLLTSMGNNGFLFESDSYSEIKEIIIISGSSSTQDKFVFNGYFVVNPFPQQITETALGRLVWESNSSVNIIEQEVFLNIYPNPVNTFLNLELNEPAQIHIVNVLGETVATHKFNGGNNSIDVSGLTSGVYFLQTENYKTIKIIKQ